VPAFADYVRTVWYNKMGMGQIMGLLILVRGGRFCMNNWKQLFLRNTGISPYVWVVFYILPFYFIFRSPSTYQIAIGIVLTVGFFISYVLSFISRGRLVYLWTVLQLAISAVMAYVFSYIYFFLFPAYFIGRIQGKASFISLYTILVITAYAAVNYEFLTRDAVLITQLPFVFICLIAVTLLPVNTHNRNKEVKLQGQLEDANKRIAELVKLDERQRIARDLHDTLGQQLSLIGLKSDLASRLLRTNPDKALAELNDIHQTARVALQEVRELVTEMRGMKLEDEIITIEKMLQAAGIEFRLEGEPKLKETSLLAENVACMCLKEAVTNVVKHSGATSCTISIEETNTGLTLRIKDDGSGMPNSTGGKGNGLRGMKERVEFVNGSLSIRSNKGTTITIRIPSVVKPSIKEGRS